MRNIKLNTIKSKIYNIRYIIYVVITKVLSILYCINFTFLKKVTVLLNFSF